MTDMMTVQVNGENRRVSRSATVLDLLRQFDLDPRTVVVELNRELIRGQTLGNTVLSDGDRLELVHFVGGG